ncbi:MAG: rhomboid family intramembrane serine protease [Bacteroidetes bacterium]|nr:rhomboid family intramembrane serine protease [Bacteroidota bacterium]
MDFSISLIIIIITCIVSISAFSNQKIIEDLIFYPPAVSQHKQWYRFFSCGLIHADWAHLFFNMYVLYMFGMGQRKSGVEYIFKDVFDSKGSFLYLVMYIAALAVCLIPTYNKNKDNYSYRSLGASGAVSAVVFAYMLFNPMQGMGLLFLPIYIPGFLFGIIYLAVSSWLDKRGGGNINHSAHIWGAIFGIVFVIFACYIFSGYPVLQNFIEQIKNTSPSKLIQFG